MNYPALTVGTHGPYLVNVCPYVPMNPRRCCFHSYQGGIWHYVLKGRKRELPYYLLRCCWCDKVRGVRGVGNEWCSESGWIE